MSKNHEMEKCPDCLGTGLELVFIGKYAIPIGDGRNKRDWCKTCKGKCRVPIIPDQDNSETNKLINQR